VFRILVNFCSNYTKRQSVKSKHVYISIRLERIKRRIIAVKKEAQLSLE